jgi:hypothetical protein
LVGRANDRTSEAVLPADAAQPRIARQVQLSHAAFFQKAQNLKRADFSSGDQ